MKSFTFEQGTIVRILAALIADELARRHKRYTESLVHSGWGAETSLGVSGLALTPEQVKDCSARAAEFFGHGEVDLPTDGSCTIGDWAGLVAEKALEKLTEFSFYPTTQTGEAATTHPADDMFQDGAAVASLLSGRKRTIAMVPPHSLLGLNSSVIAPNLQRIEVLDARRFTPDELSETLRFGDLVVATPTLWRYLAATLPEIPGNVVGLSFGEALTMDVAQKLRQRGIGAIRELYGSTETGVVGWRDSQSEPFVLLDHWSRDGEAIVRHRANGRTARLIPMDEIEWESDRSFRLGPRRDGAVQIGAVNVFPQQISEIIAGGPGVVSCEVRLSRRPGTLDRLIADVTLSPGLEIDQDLAWEIDEWCRERLRPAERPRIYHFYSAQ
ncbi:hypothetical protein [Parvularcula maris]|uniref:AMP-dependent synthetase/ligase domain-containing protein n=1 Tax=Parvularcula maris TaxID=2965077 RepID=A0A9X2RHT0_9PROT|nr:hypothetical protein [Parvularcula maris]MCQ8185189.1 hypothetical protein [Parvularcula maris]